MVNSLRNFLWFVVGVLLVSVPMFSFAAIGILPPNGVAGPYSTWFPTGQTGIGILPPPVTSTAAAGASDMVANVSTSVAIRAAGGAVVDVPVTAVATVGADAVAATAVKLIPILGQLATAVMVAQMLKDAGFRYGNCQNPGLIVGPGVGYCKPDPMGSVVTGYRTTASQFGWRNMQAYPSQSALCNAFAAAANSTYNTPGSVGTVSGSNCLVTGGALGSSTVSAIMVAAENVCSDGVTPVASCGAGGQTYSPATGDDIAGALKLKMISDSNARKALFDAERADIAANPQLSNLPPAVPYSSPVSVTAPPVTSAPSSPSVQTIPKPDGSIDTVRTTEQTTVTPTTTGTTVGDTKTTFPSTTTTTTTTTNNVTNQTTTSTNVVNNPPALPQFPNDYNKEVTQQKIADALSGKDAAPIGTLYTKKTPTVADTFHTFTSALQSAPFLLAAQNFFGVSVNAGSCPSMIAGIGYFHMSLDAGQYFCTPAVANMLFIAGVAVLIGAAYVAFRMAFL